MTGGHLDRIGLDWGVPRRPGERNHDYNSRILAHIASPLAGSLGAILLAAERVLPASVNAQVEEARLAVTVRLLEPPWRRLLIIPAWRDRRRVRAAVKSQVAAGVVLVVR